MEMVAERTTDWQFGRLTDWLIGRLAIGGLHNCQS